MASARNDDERLHEQVVPYRADDLAPPDVYDPVLEAYEKDVDRTLLRENLKLTPAQRVQKMSRFIRSRELWANHGVEEEGKE
jgi:hypothetical protein